MEGNGEACPRQGFWEQIIREVCNDPHFNQNLMGPLMKPIITVSFSISTFLACSALQYGSRAKFRF